MKYLKHVMAYVWLFMSFANFTTAAIISAFVLDSKFGLDQGFDYYNDRLEEKRNAMKQAAKNTSKPNAAVSIANKLTQF